MFWNNKLFLLELVKSNGNNLCLIPDIFRNDKEIVFEAVKQNHYSLEFSSKRLKNNIRSC